MNTPTIVYVAVFVLCTLTTAMALDCLFCASDESLEKCQGIKQTCPQLADRCITYTVTADISGKKTTTFAKSCAPSAQCDKEKFPGCKKISIPGAKFDCDIKCCEGNLCNDKSVKPKTDKPKTGSSKTDKPPTTNAGSELSSSGLSLVTCAALVLHLFGKL